MRLLNWYKFVFTDKQYSTFDKIYFIAEHILVVIIVFLLYKAISDFDSAEFYVGLSLVILIPLLNNARKSYRKYTVPYQEEYYKTHEMTEKDREMLEVKQKLLEQVEEASKEL